MSGGRAVVVPVRGLEAGTRVQLAGPVVRDLDLEVHVSGASAVPPARQRVQDGSRGAAPPSFSSRPHRVYARPIALEHAEADGGGHLVDRKHRRADGGAEMPRGGG